MSQDKRVDEDWKRRAQAEKELDAAKFSPAPAPAAAAAGGAAPTPGASRSDVKANPLFGGLIESLASQALMFMGAMRDPMTGQAHQDFQQSQAMIEMLAMLEEKTKGNLAKEETDMLKQVLDEVRMHFVRLTSPPPPNPKGPMMGNKPR
ncbi:MAG TPA: DUF1844 domain-containing protein [Planctomycetota bacterium]|jgi:hypothetical protein|nr:DUF1844 domain-containing protein [Planctomycetota bacterium]